MPDKKPVSSTKSTKEFESLVAKEKEALAKELQAFKEKNPKAIKVYKKSNGTVAIQY
jgi:hypothetical protein